MEQITEKTVRNAVAYELLVDLTQALDNAYISSWQTTAAWQEQLDAALEFLKENPKE